jgi:site-specific recombinase XerD
MSSTATESAMQKDASNSKGGPRRKRDDAPRGVRRHPSGVWAIRYSCGRRCVHKERIGPIRGDAIRAYHDRRRRAHDEPGWCPTISRRQDEEQARAAQVKESRRRTFGQYAKDYLAWAKLHHRGWRTEQGRVNAMVAVFGEVKLEALTTAEVEFFLDGLLATRAQATRNRYRTTLHAMFNRARRHGFATVNPVTGITKAKESEGRLLFLMPDEEGAILTQLTPDATAVGRPTLDARRGDLRPLFLVSVHTGLRWSEQQRLQWRDVDFLTGLLTVSESKSGYSRQIPMNSLVRPVLMDLAGQRSRPDDPEELVFRCPFGQADKFFPKAVERAQASLRQARKDATRLEGYTWHCNRHTFASRLVMAGVDLRTIQVLGGWRTLAMVQRYSHLAPDHLLAAVERLVPVTLTESDSTRKRPDTQTEPAGVM